MQSLLNFVINHKMLLRLLIWGEPRRDEPRGTFYSKAITLVLMLIVFSKTAFILGFTFIEAARNAQRQPTTFLSRISINNPN
jgi:hypothetical protein